MYRHTQDSLVQLCGPILLLLLFFDLFYAMLTVGIAFTCLRTSSLALWGECIISHIQQRYLLNYLQIEVNGIFYMRVMQRHTDKHYKSTPYIILSYIVLLWPIRDLIPSWHLCHVTGYRYSSESTQSLIVKQAQGQPRGAEYDTMSKLKQAYDVGLLQYI